MGWLVDGFSSIHEGCFQPMLFLQWSPLPSPPHWDLHQTCKSLPFPNLQLLITSDSSQVDACTQTHARIHRIQVPHLHSPTKPDWKRHFYSWAMSDAPVGSIMMRRDGGNQSWEHPDRSWQVSGTAWEGMWGGEVGATQTSPSKIPYTCNHARTQRWSKGNI